MRSPWAGKLERRIDDQPFQSAAAGDLRAARYLELWSRCLQRLPNWTQPDSANEVNDK